jgi:hypothetical protein
MAELDRALTRGERAVAGVDRLSALATPFTTLVRAAYDASRRGRQRETRPRRTDDDGGHEDATAV